MKQFWKSSDIVVATIPAKLFLFLKIPQRVIA